MNILITAGGTSEKIDDVRKISNTGTGRLGSLIADCFLEDPETCVTCLCSENAVHPKNPRARIVSISDVHSLQQAVERELHQTAFDAVIHSMAVSDYTVGGSFSAEALAAQLAQSLRGAPKSGDLEQQIYAALLGCGGKPAGGKLSSNIGHLFLRLEKTPKIIGMFKALQPKTVLVGFKLLSGVAESELLQVAHGLMERNGCDFVLANDQNNICETYHKAMLLGSDGTAVRLETKQEIAQAIKNNVVRKIGEDKRK